MEYLWLEGRKTPRRRAVKQMVQSRIRSRRRPRQASAALKKLKLPALLAFVRQHERWP